MSLLLNGTSQYLWLPSSLVGSSGLGPWTLACWAKGASQTARIIAFGHSVNSNPIVSIGASATAINGFFRGDTGSDTAWNNLYGNPFASSSTWHHVAAVYSGGTFTAYIDGVAQTPTVAATPGTTTLNRTTIGALLRSSASNFFTGRIAESGIWTSDQSANIPALANATAAPRPSEYPTGLAAYLPLLSDTADPVGNVWTYVDSAHTDPDIPTIDADHPTMVSAGLPHVYAAHVQQQQIQQPRRRAG